MSDGVPTYHIIGAGIAGLSAAVYLQQKHPSAQIIVYEAASHPGGRAYSFIAPDWEMALDNATHVILGANRHSLKLCGKGFPAHQVRFYNLCSKTMSITKFACKNEISEAIFNTSFQDVSLRQWLKVLRQLFPFTPRQFKAGFSHGNLNELLISPLAKQIKDIRYGWKLTGFTSEAKRITTLDFDSRKVEVLPEDKVISAMDSHSYCKIFKAEDFDYHSIINIYFHTSMQITLPKQQTMLGICGGLAQWLFTSPELLAVTISNADNIALENDELARQVWQEICAIRGREAAFMPDYKVLRHKRATIKQDKPNNAKRPQTAQTRWKNLQLCGDWTVKDSPCCLETAIRSALRLK